MLACVELLLLVVFTGWSQDGHRKLQRHDVAERLAIAAVARWARLKTAASARESGTFCTLNLLRRQRKGAISSSAPIFLQRSLVQTAVKARARSYFSALSHTHEGVFT